MLYEGEADTDKLGVTDGAWNREQKPLQLLGAGCSNRQILLKYRLKSPSRQKAISTKDVNSLPVTSKPWFEKVLLTVNSPNSLCRNLLESVRKICEPENFPIVFPTKLP